MSGHRILIVDDSPYTGEAVAWALRKAGFEPVVARDLWDLERPDVGIPDLVLMDVVLGEAFGDDLAPLLRDARGFTCPILLFSSLPDAELAQRAADAGVDGFISKRVGLPGVVARATELLGQPPFALPGGLPEGTLALTARQRVRRIVHVYGETQHWNTAAIIAEAHALAGDADLAGATQIAAAARGVHDVAGAHGQSGSTPAITAAIATLCDVVGASSDISGRLLVVDASGFCREMLYAGLDGAGFVIMEAQALAEARQKLQAADYDAILVDDRLAREDAALVPELREGRPGVGIHIVGISPLDKDLAPTRLVDEIRELARRG